MRNFTIFALAVILLAAIVAPIEAKKEECELCTLVISTAQRELQKEKSIDAIINALVKACSLVPEPLSDACEAFVEAKGAAAIQHLMANVSAERVCEKLHACKDDDKKAAPAVLPMTRIVPAKRASVGKKSGECVLCEFIMDKLETLITANSSQQHIEDALDKVCGMLPKTLEDDCDAMVATYLPEIVQLLVNKEPPKTVCAQLGLCHHENKKAVDVKPTTPVRGPMKGTKCALCELVMREVKEHLMENSTEEVITHVVERVCEYLPNSVEKDCEGFIEEHGPSVINALASRIDPESVCTYVGVCGDESKEARRLRMRTVNLSRHVAKKAKKVKANALECKLCDEAMKVIDKMLTDDKDQTKILHAIESACDLIPSKALKNECDAFIENYGEAILNFLADKGTPQEVCVNLIHVCEH